MYKVFVNEKRLSISKSPIPIEKNLPYEGTTTVEIALDVLENTSTPEINIYGEHLDEILGRTYFYAQSSRSCGRNCF